MIGVLDLQGDVVEHLDHLKRLGVPSRRIKTSEDMSGLSGIIIPGGESSCLSRLLRIFGLHEAIVAAANGQRMKIWGTCAGAILLAKAVVGEPTHLGLIDLEIERNSFGSQLDSFAYEALIPQVSPDPLELIFIRAPKIKKVGPGVQILLQVDDYIAAAEDGQTLLTVFHPELTGSLAFHRYFALKCDLAVQSDIPLQDPTWTTTSWTRLARIAA
jgi:5'-phosphate synthase pdxT subunit